MAELISENIYLIILLPLWIFLMVMLGRFFSVYIKKAVVQLLTLFASGIGAASTLILYKLLPPDTIYEISYPFIQINDFVIPFGIHIDRLALIFTSVLFLVSFMVQLFSISYMKDERKQYRFFGLINLFNFSLAGLFLSPNLYQTYVFWEIAGVVSYLLIGFEYFKPEKSLAAKKVFIINRIGDTAFLAGIIICSYLLYEYAPAKSLVSLSFFDMNTVSILISAYTSRALFIIVCLLFVIAAAVKSAQFPFYTWLQDAMEAKLPVSSLLHSATLVALGVYLIIRMTPMFSLDPFVLKIVAILGLLTAFICSSSACTQQHPKKALAYSTSAQLGLMFFAVGILNIKAAVALFAAHAFIKSLLFITLPKENEKWNFINFIIFLVGGLSLSGILLSGMMIAKEMLAYNLSTEQTTIISVLSFITAFYIIRIALVTSDNNGLEKTKPQIIELLSAIGLMILNIALYAYLRKIGEYHIAESFWAALTAWIVVYIMYIKHSFFKIPYIYQLCYNGFYLDKLYMTLFLGIYNKFSELLSKFDKNILGNYNLLINFSKFAVKVTGWIETKIMNGSVNFTVDFVKRISAISKQLQTKNVQRYNSYAFMIIATVLSCLVVTYVAILAYFRGVI